MSATRRRSILVDQEVQGALILRVIAYWLYCLLSVSLMTFCWAVYHGPQRPLSVILTDMAENYAPALAASLILLPIVMVDIVRFSNAFVGPVYRLKCSMQRLTQGEQVSPLAFRDNDYWPDLAAAFNALVARAQPEPDDSSAAVLEPVASGHANGSCVGD